MAFWSISGLAGPFIEDLSELSAEYDPAICLWVKKGALGMRGLTAALGACALAACSQSIVPGAVAGAPAVRSVPSSRSLGTPSVPIYVLGGSAAAGPEILGYGVRGSSKPVVIAAAGLINPAEIAIDGRGVIYVGDTGTETHQSSSVAEYRVGHKGPLRTVSSGIAYPFGIAVSGKGQLYVANAYAGKYGDMAIYKPDAVKPALVTAAGVHSPSAIAVDKSGFVSLGNQAPTPYGDVKGYPPKTKTPTVTVTDDVSDPTLISVDSSGNLYIANWPVANPPRVTEYARHSSRLVRTLNVGSTGFITSLTVDALGDVYAAAARTVLSRWYGSITVFGPTGQRPIRTIHFRVGDVPTSIASDDAGDLYALAGSKYGENPPGYSCEVSCSLWEYSDGWKTRTLIARSAGGSEHFLTGPVVTGDP